VVYYGFNKKIGNISYYDSSGQRDMGIQKPFSEETGKLIDEEIRTLVSSAYDNAIEILHQNIDALNRVAELLLKKEVVFRDDLENILGKRPENPSGAPARKDDIGMGAVS
jgi:cell division protease FtsH